MGSEIMPPKTQPEVVVRTAQPEDAPASGQICYNAFSTINATHGFPCDFPASEAATGVLSMMFANPGFYCVVAESDGRIIGSNFHLCEHRHHIAYVARFAERVLERLLQHIADPASGRRDEHS